MVFREFEVDNGRHFGSLVDATDRRCRRLVLCYDSCESRGCTTCARSCTSGTNGLVDQWSRGFDEALTAKERQTQGRNGFTKETVIVARWKRIQVWRTTIDSDVILIVVDAQPPSIGILGMSH